MNNFVKLVDNSKALSDFMSIMRQASDGAPFGEVTGNLIEELNRVIHAFLSREQIGRAYIYVSYLRTRILSLTPVFRIDMYDESWFLDSAECCFEWDVSKIYGPLFEKASELRKKTAAMFVENWEFDRVFMQACDELNDSLTARVVAAMPSLIVREAFCSLAERCGVQIYMGEYQDSVRLLYTSDGTEAYGFG